jgi:hypothetical protein
MLVQMNGSTAWNVMTFGVQHAQTRYHVADAIQLILPISMMSITGAATNIDNGATGAEQMCVTTACCGVIAVISTNARSVVLIIVACIHAKIVRGCNLQFIIRRRDTQHSHITTVK